MKKRETLKSISGRGDGKWQTTATLATYRKTRDQRRKQRKAERRRQAR